MAKFEFEKSSVVAHFIERVKEAGYGATTQDTIDFYNSTIASMVEFLARAKSRTNKTAIAIKDLKGNLKIAAIVTYHPNENEEMPGNWSLEFTFDKNDLDDVTLYETTDTQYQQIALQVMHRVGNFTIENAAVLQTLYEISVDCLLHWADSNAEKEGEEATLVTSEGYFVLSSVLEKGEKIISLDAHGNMKRLIKDDTALEK